MPVSAELRRQVEAVAPGQYADYIWDIKSDDWARAIIVAKESAPGTYATGMPTGYQFGTPISELFKGISQALGFTAKDVAQPPTPSILSIIPGFKLIGRTGIIIGGAVVAGIMGILLMRR